MKKLLSLIAAIGCLAGAESALATGTLGPNPTQSGSLTFNVTTGFYITNSFAYPFTTTPVLQLFAGTTNATPITNILVTATNFAVSVNATNPASQVNWIASIGYARMASGTNAIQGNLLLTNVFAQPFAFNPVVVISGSTTNTALQGTACISSVSPTNFVIQCGNTNQVFYWHALGVSLNPGVYNPASPQITY